MIESEWLTSNDPVQLLNWHFRDSDPLGPYGDPDCAKQENSMRRLRLFTHAASCEQCTSAIDGMSDYLRAALYVASANCGKRPEKASLIHCIFGNPFRQIVRDRPANDPFNEPRVIPRGAIRFRDAWLAWNNRTVPCMAESIYQRRAWEEMPILADALEEAGCDNETILDHCRGIIRFELSAENRQKRRALQTSGLRVLCARGCCYECASCSAQPGSPTLCAACLELRRLCAQARGRWIDDTLIITDNHIHARGCWVVDLLLLGKG